MCLIENSLHVMNLTIIQYKCYKVRHMSLLLKLHVEQKYEFVH